MFVAFRSFIVLVLVVLFMAAWLLMPNSNEHSSMMLRDGRPVEVIAWLEPKKNSGKWQPRELTALARAYKAIGDYDNAIEVMETYVSKRPDDPSALNMLADLYAVTGNIDGMLEARNHSLVIAPDKEQLGVLLAQYRLNNKFDQELNLLNKFRNTDYLSDDDHFRLAKRLLNKNNANKTDLASAIDILSKIDDDTEICNDEKCTLLFRLLMASGQQKVALKRAKQWFAQAKQTWLVAELLKQNGMTERDVAELAGSALTHDQNSRFYMVRVMDELGHRKAAVYLLEGWLDDNPAPSAKEIAAFVSSTRVIGASNVAFQAFSNLLTRSKYNQLHASFARVLSETYGSKALAPIFAQLSKKELTGNDISSAQIAMAMNNPDLVMHFLKKASTTSMNRKDRKSWLVLVRAVSNKWKLQNNKMVISS